MCSIHYNNRTVCGLPHLQVSPSRWNAGVNDAPRRQTSARKPGKADKMHRKTTQEIVHRSDSQRGERAQLEPSSHDRHPVPHSHNRYHSRAPRLRCNVKTKLIGISILKHTQACSWIAVGWCHVYSTALRIS